MYTYTQIGASRSSGLFVIYNSTLRTDARTQRHTNERTYDLIALSRSSPVERCKNSHILFLYVLVTRVKTGVRFECVRFPQCVDPSCRRSGNERHERTRLEFGVWPASGKSDRCNVGTLQHGNAATSDSRTGAAFLQRSSGPVISVTP